MATLRFNFGTMGSGKSTMALQIHHNLASRQLYGLLLTKLDREGAQVTSRLGVAAQAVEVLPNLDLYKLAVDHWPIHYLVCVGCSSPHRATVRQLRPGRRRPRCRRAFSLITDLRRLFDGTKRMLESPTSVPMQGAIGAVTTTHNARGQRRGGL
jgi:thymidine kinase